MKFIEDICQGIVCPPKLRYSPYDLGSAFSTQGRRHDFQVVNTRGLRIQASFYENSRNKSGICVVYLHSMNGSRLQSITYADFVMRMGLSFCNFDFAGCGNSEGTAISFGANEKHDVLAVLDALSDQWNVQRVVLWGRSMGAASAIKYCELVQNYRTDTRNEVLGVVLDSCFRSFDQLAVEIGRRHSQVPAFLIKMGYYLIRSTLEERGSFKIEQLQLQDVMGQLAVPALFLASHQDDTVRSEHSEALFNRCAHQRKKLTYIRGLHNEARDEDCLKEIRNFIEEVMVQRNRPRCNKFESIAIQRRNFTVQGSEWQNGNECTCSLFPSPVHQELPTTRRKQSQALLQKIKVNRMPHNRYNFRSTDKVPQVSFQVPL